VVVADDQLETMKFTLSEVREEIAPAHLGFRKFDAEAEFRSAAVTTHADRRE